MGALHLSFAHRAGTIKRVVRRGETYICGLCRSPYDHLDEAQSCVQRCWTELLTLDPIVVRRRGGGIVFRCRFCARDYHNADDGRGCAAECIDHHTDLHDREQALVDQSDSPPPKRHQRPKLVAVRALAPAPRPKPKAEPVAEAAPAQEAPAADTISVDAKDAPVSAADTDASKAKRAKRTDGEMFSRDGARYVCLHCKEKYFTRDEVVKCFEGHE